MLADVDHKAVESAGNYQREQMKIVIVGHVDHGKSSLVGRLFYETDSLEDGKYEALLESCKKRGMPFEWSFLLDALQAERNQGITIDTTQIWFKTKKRDYVIIDAPGHKEFLKNMISGAASADAAILLIDAKEGIREQSKRHGYLLHMLGIEQIAVVVNKMDLVQYSQQRFADICEEYSQYLHSVGVCPTCFIPVSAREGEGITMFGEKMSWCTDIPTVREALDGFMVAPTPTDLPLRFPVQDVYKFDDRRIIAGRIETGALAVGDKILFSPSNKITRIASIELWPAPDTQPTRAYAGQSVGITLEEQLFVERGEVISHLSKAPLLSNRFNAKIIWLGDRALMLGNSYKIKLNTAEFHAEVSEIHRQLNTDELTHCDSDHIPKHAIGAVTFRVRGMAALDDYSQNKLMGRFVIVDGYDVVGGGIIDLHNIADQRIQPKIVKSRYISKVEQRVTTHQRAVVNGHLPGILWFTGLSGSGKSTLTQELQARLFAKGYQVVVLDGDNIRHGLCSDLGFAPADRSENIRRVGEVAALFAKAGFIVLTAFISPYVEDRRRARNAAPEYFHTIYVQASLETCESRDTKGLYAKARAGEIKYFTGIDDPYEPPIHADLTIDTEKLAIEEATELLVEYVENQLVKPLVMQNREKLVENKV